MMTRLLLAAMLAFTLQPVHAQKKSCDELKTEIEAKVKAKGVKAFSVDIVAAADVKDATVVGSCDGGTKKIVYKRG
jgi:Protein of unknown function (DUF1161)